MIVRTATVQDASKIVTWSVCNKAANDLDMDVFSYPLMEIFCAENGSPVAYLPVQLAAILESFAPRPDATDAEKRRALHDLLSAILPAIEKRGVREVYFIASEDSLLKDAERLGFQKIEAPVYRLKLKGEECDSITESSAT
jgi:hypothetical protein